MGSRFENFSIGRAVGKFLGIKDLKNFPNELNVDQVQPVLDIGPMRNYVFENAPHFSYGQQDLNGSSLWTLNLLGLASTLPSIENQFLEATIEALEIDLNWDAAGGTSMAGKKVGVDIRIEEPAGQTGGTLISGVYNLGLPNAGVAGGFAASLNGMSYHQDVLVTDMRPYGLSAGRVITIPAGWILEVDIYLSSGTFPVNTLLSGSVCAKLTPDTRGPLINRSQL